MGLHAVVPQKGYRPREHHNLSTLRHIYSTGSPLAPPLFDYVYQHIHPKVLLGSITGAIAHLYSRMSSKGTCKVERTYALFLLECVLRFQCFAGKSSVECSEWQLKASPPRELLTHLINLVSLFASSPSHVCLLASGLCLGLVRTAMWN